MGGDGQGASIGRDEMNIACRIGMAMTCCAAVALLVFVRTPVLADGTASDSQSLMHPASTQPAAPDVADPDLADPNPTPTNREADSITRIIQLTFGRDFARAGEGYFSQDMHWIIFQAAPKGQEQYQMFVAPLKRDDGGDIVGTGTAVQISPQASRNTCGYFSPDGTFIIFGSTAGKEDPSEPSPGYQRKGGTYRWSFPRGMDIFRADNWQAAVESAISGAAAGQIPQIDLAKRRLTDNDSYDAEGSLSPDGRFICFTSKRTGNLNVYAMNADGSHVVPLVTAAGYNGGPFFSPDGKRLVYRSDHHGNDLLQVFVSDLVFDSSGQISGAAHERQLTSDANVNWGPFWYPDGKHIVWASSKYGHTNYELFLMRDDGTHKTRITFWPGADVLPVFSPDGKYLMWTSKRSPDQTSQLFVAHFALPHGS
jgi:TolB protein